MDELYNEAVYSKNVLEFIRVAHEYCTFIEKAAGQPSNELVDFFRKVGPLMYLKGELLPIIEDAEPEFSERFVTEEEWGNVFNQLREILGKLDVFYQVDPDDPDNYEPARASLSENMSDIYQDLKDFLLLYQKHSQEAKKIAVFDCRQWFEKRWGLKLLHCLNYLHYLKYQPGMEDNYPDLL